LPRIELPGGGWRPRGHQLKLWTYLEQGGKRALEIAHRRWGKDEVALHRAAIAAHERIGSYWHMLPEYGQARKAIWSAVNPHTGRRRIDEAFPRQSRETTNETEMFIRFKNGSTWQVIGSDNYNRLVGASIAGITFSEFATSNPASWAYLAPILVENDGWALFITTPRGRNHVHKMRDVALASPHWFCEIATVDDTGALPLEAVETQRREYHALYGEDAGDALIEQEYWCSFEAAILGAYYGKELARAMREGRIREVPPDPDFPVHTAWDLGVDDSNTMWFYQIAGNEVHVVDYYEASGYAIPHYAEVKREKGYNYKGGKDYVPHDARQRSYTSAHEDGTAKQRIEVMVECGLNPVVVPNHALIDGISAVRQTLARCVFDAGNCETGLEALRQYQREWDEGARVFQQKPLHNWASHGADAFRTLAMAWRESTLEKSKAPDIVDPSGRGKVLGSRPKVLSEMTYDEFAPLGGPRSRRPDRV